MKLTSPTFVKAALAAVAVSIVFGTSPSIAKSVFDSNHSPAIQTTDKRTVLAVAGLERRRSEINIKVNGKVTRTGEVYLLRGLANVFSRGMDTLGAKMVRAGLDARVFNHAAWEELAYNIHLRNKYGKISHPIIIMGHSLGANATFRMAKYLGDRGIKVKYAVAFDGTQTLLAPSNVGRAINYYLPNDSKSNIIRKGPGFRGTIKNINVSRVPGITHTTVEKQAKFHDDVLKRTLSFTRKKR